MKNIIENIADKIKSADAILIGAGAGLSTSAGFVYNGERFEKYFWDFIEKYNFRGMYEGGFYPFDSMEENWAYWSRYIYINRYMDTPLPLYEKLFDLVKNKNYFVLTTNVDHCFQKAGFSKDRIFYTQGDFGLFQCSTPCHNKTYENEATIRKMILSQGFVIDNDGVITVPEDNSVISMAVPSELLPKCPVCNKPMSMNLRADDTFVQDDGWDIHAGLYEDFLNANKKRKIVFIELGVGFNTPGIIKYPFWQMTMNNDASTYICINKGEANVPSEISSRSICVDDDIYSIICSLHDVLI